MMQLSSSYFAVGEKSSSSAYSRAPALEETDVLHSKQVKLCEDASVRLALKFLHAL